MYNLLLYSIVLVIVIWAMEGVNINTIFKKNRMYQARVMYILIVLSLTYLSSNFILDFLNSLK
ncbi:MAG: DUF1146 family protein [bacterium]|nr:DUF1146 family protein [bacterium]